MSEAGLFPEPGKEDQAETRNVSCLTAPAASAKAATSAEAPAATVKSASSSIESASSEVTPIHVHVHAVAAEVRVADVRGDTIGAALRHPLADASAHVSGWKPIGPAGRRQVAAPAQVPLVHSIRNPLSCALANGAAPAKVTRAHLVAGTAPANTLTEPLLGLSDGRPLSRAHAARALEPVRYGRIAVRHAAPVGRVMHPSIAAPDIDPVEIVAGDEIVVDDDIAASPSWVPTPIAPATAPDCAHEQARPKRNGAGCHYPAIRRIVEWRIRIIWRRPPDCHRIILRNVYDFGLSRLNYNEIAPVFRRRAYGLLWRRFQCAAGHGPLPKVLNCLHDAILLRQKGVSEIGRPLYVLIHAIQDIRHEDQCLNAGVPRLLLRGVGQGLALEIRVLADPSSRFHDFQRICGCDEYLTQDRVRVQGDWGDEALELLRRQGSLGLTGWRGSGLRLLGECVRPLRDQHGRAKNRKCTCDGHKKCVTLVYCYGLWETLLCLTKWR